MRRGRAEGARAQRERGAKREVRGAPTFSTRSTPKLTALGEGGRDERGGHQGDVLGGHLVRHGKALVVKDRWAGGVKRDFEREKREKRESRVVVAPIPPSKGREGGEASHPLLPHHSGC